eukprot:gene2093-2411_t
MSWRCFKAQVNDAYHSFMYWLEIAATSPEDLPWVDTLDFFWESLPGADKLTSAERRRLAKSIRQMVRQDVQRHYSQELSHKAAIQQRQLRRQQLAEQHLQELAARRHQEMRAMSLTARQQSLIPPAEDLISIPVSTAAAAAGAAGQPWPQARFLRQQCSWHRHHQRALGSVEEDDGVQPQHLHEQQQFNDAALAHIVIDEISSKHASLTWSEALAGWQLGGGGRGEDGEAAGVAAALTCSFLETDRQLTCDDGCTATAVLLEGCPDGCVLLRVANVGDSMALLVDLGRLILAARHLSESPVGCRVHPPWLLALSQDHRIAVNSLEAARLTAKNSLPAGAVSHRLYGLNIARMLGDRFLKEADVGFTAEPYVSEGVALNPEDEVLVVVASDGLWDVRLASSMEARCQQFQTDAQRPRDQKTSKDIDKLKKFLYKNQEYRFSDKEQTYLFQAVQLYAHSYIAVPVPDSPAVELVEDALKMPFTVFSTNQKKTMLKLLDKLNGLEEESAAAVSSSSQQQYTVLDVTDSLAEVMDEAGDTQQVDLAVCDLEVVDSLRRAFASEPAAELVVELGVRYGKLAICKLLTGK